MVLGGPSLRCASPTGSCWSRGDTDTHTHTQRRLLLMPGAGVQCGSNDSLYSCTPTPSHAAQYQTVPDQQHKRRPSSKPTSLNGYKSCCLHLHYTHILACGGEDNSAVVRISDNNAGKTKCNPRATQVNSVNYELKFGITFTKEGKQKNGVL